MSTSASTALPRARRRGRPAPITRAIRIPRPELAGVLALAGVLNLWVLNLNGYANEYYAAAVRSMSASWHAFLFGSLDLAGLQTVDKPPLALWVQALSVRVFGFSSWSLLVPQALMGVATVGLTYDLVRRRFGRAAGLAAGLVLALTPITVAISRHNNPDALLILCCVAALWATVRGLEDGRARWLMIAAACVGLGFETKMGVALMVVPGIAAAWLWAAPRGRRVALGQLTGAAAVAAVVGLAWPVMVWLTPAADRPWISGTSDNSIWSLILDYNGLGRVTGQQGAGGNGGGMFGGKTGVLRLLNDSLGGQAGWLLGAAVVTGIALIVLTRLRRGDERTGWLVAVGGAFAVTAVVFSMAQGIFHPYYVSLLAPFSAALVGAGVGLALDHRALARRLGAAALAAGMITEVAVLHAGATDLAWAAPVVIAGVAAGLVFFALARSARARAIAVGAMLALLLAAPATWAVDTLGHATSGTFPAGGPASTGLAGGGRGGAGAGRAGGPGRLGAPSGGAGTAAARPGASASGSFGRTGSAPPAGRTGSAPAAGRTGGGRGAGGAVFGGDSATLTAAIRYVAAHDGGTLVVSSQSSAAAAILASDANVAGIGGFSGNETEISAAWFVHEVKTGAIRYVLVDDSSGAISDGRVGASEIMALVKKVGTRVSSVSGLYDVQGAASRLAAAAG
ncbi:MAG: glycosyltransferase family 39 protein [Solirubrobacteraceae bacterium]